MKNKFSIVIGLLAVSLFRFLCFAVGMYPMREVSGGVFQVLFEIFYLLIQQPLMYGALGWFLASRAFKGHGIDKSGIVKKFFSRNWYIIIPAAVFYFFVYANNSLNIAYFQPSLFVWELFFPPTIDGISAVGIFNAWSPVPIYIIECLLQPYTHFSMILCYLIYDFRALMSKNEIRISPTVTS